jgi:preprotein translocase subunit Sss1
MRSRIEREQFRAWQRTVRPSWRDYEDVVLILLVCAIILLFGGNA